MNKMHSYLGIDTSNYTTSVAVCSAGTMLQKKQLLPVKKGALGLRQSDAVFHHTQQLPYLIEEVLKTPEVKLKAIGVSVKPRSIEGSYMPCFTTGKAAAVVLCAALSIPMYKFSHQQGHVAAALYGADKTELLRKPFLAFHVSGGTTEALLIAPQKETVFSEQLVAQTLDLNAGQLVDRIGVSLGLKFPCGNALEQLAKKYNHSIKVKSTCKGASCCLSGVENICKKMLEQNQPKEKIAAYTLKYIEQTLLDMATELKKTYGNLPILFSGGVMSNSIIRENLSNELGAYFSKPEFSADNAAGVAWLAKLIDNK